MQRRKKYAKINRIVAIYRFSADKKKIQGQFHVKQKKKCREIFRINFGQWNPTVAKKTHTREYTHCTRQDTHLLVTIFHSVGVYLQ